MSLTKRTDKLKFLQGLRNGTTSLDELRDSTTPVFAIVSKDDPNLFDCEGELHTKQELARMFPNRAVFLVASLQEMEDVIQIGYR